MPILAFSLRRSLRLAFILFRCSFSMIFCCSASFASRSAFRFARMASSFSFSA
jgi:hypothetical protein